MVDDEMIEATLEGWNGMIKKAVNGEKFFNTELIQLVWAKYILEKEMED